MPECKAWVLNLDGRLRVAVGERELLHLVQVPQLFEIPESPFYCRHVVVWQDDPLPVMDLAAWLRGCKVPREPALLGIVAYQERPGTSPRYGALRLAAIPVLRVVGDSQACALPEQPAGWKTLSSSCFADAGGAVPILNLPNIFSGGLMTA